MISSNLILNNDFDIINNDIINNNIINNDLNINNKISEINNLNIISKLNQKKKELLNRIERSKNETSTRLFMVTEAYDKYSYEYYIISLTILVLSSIITFIEAFRLTIIEMNSYEIIIHNKIYFSLILNIILLITGTVITILSSIIRFKNYREILEGLKEAQTILVNYKNKYNRQFFILNYHYINKNLTDNDIIKISDKITIYDKIVKSINYFQYIKNSDIVAYNKSKAKYDLNIYKIKTDTRNEFELITKKKKKKNKKK